MAWTMPPQDMLQQIMGGGNPGMAGTPTQNATTGITQTQGGQSPGRPGGGMPPANQGFATQVSGNQRNTGASPGGSSAPASPGSFGTSSYTNTSPEWYGKGNEYGTSVMARSPFAFWGGYAEDQMGLQPGSNAASFMASKYNPMAIGSAMYGKGFVSDDQIMAGSTSIANQIAGPGTTFFNPAALIGSTLQALQSGDIQALAKQNPQLANLILSTNGDPIAQVETLTGFFKELLSATMPPDVLDSFINQIQAMGQVWFSQMRKDPNMSAMDGSSFAKFLTNSLGPTLGL